MPIKVASETKWSSCPTANWVDDMVRVVLDMQICEWKELKKYLLSNPRLIPTDAN